MKNAAVFLADGFEEMEAVAPIDIMRRAGINVTTVGVTGQLVQGAHGIKIKADRTIEGFSLTNDVGLVFFPGGTQGVENLMASGEVKQILGQAAERGIFIAAVCAAPLLLHEEGLLNGKRVTAFPSVQPKLQKANVTGSAVEHDGNIITGRSAGIVLHFSNKLVQVLCGKDKADEVIESLYPQI